MKRSTQTTRAVAIAAPRSADLGLWFFFLAAAAFLAFSFAASSALR